MPKYTVNITGTFTKQIEITIEDDELSDASEDFQETEDQLVTDASNAAYELLLRDNDYNNCIDDITDWEIEDFEAVSE